MFRSIVVPVDLAEPGMCQPALKRAVEMVHDTGGTITLVNVVPVMPVATVDAVPVMFESEIAEKAKGSLAEMVARVPLPEGRVKGIVRIGGIQHEVLETAREANADLILVGSHLPDFATYILGSNATSIVRHAPCSVLVLRDAETAAAAAANAA